MNRISIHTAFLCAALTALAAPVAAGAQPASAPAASKADMPMQHGMMGSDKPMGGDASMMAMMHSCQSMMGGTAGPTALPKLPPGNEKLELQMHAEMMQKMGEIAARYADKIRDGR